MRLAFAVLIIRARDLMRCYVPPPPTADEVRENLRKDGGRKVMDGGNPYEDDLETDGAGTDPSWRLPHRSKR